MSQNIATDKDLKEGKLLLRFTEVHDAPLLPTKIDLDQGEATFKYICSSFINDQNIIRTRKGWTVQLEIFQGKCKKPAILQNKCPYKGGLYYFQDILIDSPGKWEFHLSALDKNGRKLQNLKTMSHTIAVSSSRSKAFSKNDSLPEKKSTSKKDIMPEKKSKSKRSKKELATNYRKRLRKPKAPARTCSRDELQRALTYSRRCTSGKKGRRNKLKLQKLPHRRWLVHEALAANETYMIFSRREMLSQLRAYGRRQLSSKNLC